MNATQLPSPGLVTGSHALRKEVARVITQAQMSARLSPKQTTKQVEDLITFFKAALRETTKLRVKTTGEKNERK